MDSGLVLVKRVEHNLFCGGKKYREKQQNISGKISHILSRGIITESGTRLMIPPPRKNNRKGYSERWEDVAKNFPTDRIDRVDQKTTRLHKRLGTSLFKI